MNDNIKIQFIHSDGKKYTFGTKQNPLTGSWFLTWNNWVGMYKTNKKHINSIVRDINKKARVCNY